MSKLYYCIFKVKKGIFKKTHRGNVHIFVTPAPNDQVFVFVLLGYSEEVDEWVVSLQWRHDVKLIDTVVNTLKENYGDDFSVVEEMDANIKGTSSLEFEISPSGKNKFIQGPIQFDILTKFSDRNSLLYSMDGDFYLDKVKLNQREMQVADKSISAKLRSILRKLIG